MWSAGEPSRRSTHDRRTASRLRTRSTSTISITAAASATASSQTSSSARAPSITGQIVAGIDASQEASIAIHAKHGFVKVGHLVEVGYKFDRWLDVVYMQLMVP